MGDFVNQIRNKLGLEPKREKTETGKIPNEVKVNRLQNEEANPMRPFVLAPARMNPPHVGHGEIIKTVLEQAKKHNAPHSVVLTRTHQPATAKKHGADTPNPMDPETKLHWARKFFPNANINLAHPDYPSVLHQASGLHKNGHKHLIVVCGSDQVDNYRDTLNKYNGVEGKHGYYNFDKIDVVQAGKKRTEGGKGVAGMSSSNLKAAAAQGKIPREYVPPHISDKEFREYSKHVKASVAPPELSEQNTKNIPIDDLGKYDFDDEEAKNVQGRDSVSSFNVKPDENIKRNLRRRAALKRALQTGAIGETTDISTKPNETATSTAIPTITGGVVDTIKPRKTFRELFGPTTPGEHGSPKYPLYELPPSKKKKYVAEQTEDLRSSAFRNSYGVLGELLLGKHLNGGKHVEHHRAQGKTPEEMHDHHATEAFGKNYQKHPEYKRLDEAAKLAAEKVKKHLSSSHGVTKIKRVAWTSQKSDHKKETGIDDPISKADVIVMGHNGKHVAVSVKTKHPESETKATNYANHGLKTLSSHAGVDLINDKEIQAKKKAHLELVNKILGPKHVNSSADEKHEAFKKLSKEHKAKIEKSSDELTRTTAKKYADGLKRKLKTDEHHVEHIKKSLGAAGHVHGGDEEKGKTHLPHVVSVIEPSHDNNHNTSAVDIEHHVDKTLNNYHKFKVEHNPGSIGVKITAEHKGTGRREVVHQTNVYAGGKKETAQQRTSTIFPAETRKHNMSEEYSLVEHVQSIISEAKNIDIWHAISHWDPEARYHAQEYQRRNKAMSDIVSDRTRNRPEEYAKHAEQAMMHHKKFKERLAQLAAGKNEDLKEDEDRGADSKGHKRPTEQGAGLTRKGVMAYRRKNPGSKLSTAVTTSPSKLKPGSKAANRRKSFCARMSGVKGPMKDEKGRPTRKAMSLRRWNCEASEILKTLVEAKKMKGKDPCWKDYEMVGTKQKNGREVPNCVPVDEMSVPLGTTGKRANWNPPMVGIRMASGKIEKHPPGKSGSSGGGNGGDE